MTKENLVSSIVTYLKPLVHFFYPSFQELQKRHVDYTDII